MELILTPSGRKIEIPRAVFRPFRQKRYNSAAMRIPYAVMSGAKNRFVVLDGVGASLRVTPAVARFFADRKQSGVGCDQVLLLESAQKDDEADFRYRIFNADGGEVGQCGNGARCAWRFLRESGLCDKDEIILRAEEFRVEKITVRPGEGAGSVRAIFGAPQFEPKDIPLRRPSRVPFYNLVLRTQRYAAIADEMGDAGAERQSLRHQAVGGAGRGGKPGGRFIFAALSLGNPHAVLRVEKDHGAHFGNIGRALSAQADVFPAGVNVGFYYPETDGALRLRVYERGAGETKSCGSGAVAAAVVAIREREAEGTSVAVRTRGGEVRCGWDGADSPAWIEGEALLERRGEAEAPDPE